MEKEKAKLKIVPKKYSGETSVISLRIPKEMLSYIDDISNQVGRTRNELLTMCLEFALDNIEITENGRAL